MGITHPHVLVISSVELANPTRGTPIRICKFIEQILLSGARTTVMSLSFDFDSRCVFIPTPQGSIVSRFLFYREYIKRENVTWIFAPTATNMKMVVALRLLTGVRIATDVHGLAHEEDYFFGLIHNLSRLWRGIVTSMTLKLFDRIFVVSHKMRRYFGMSEERGVVVYGGVDLTEFPLCATYRQSDEGSFEITYMGNARIYQGLFLLLDALDQFPVASWHLRLILSGGSGGDVERMIRVHGFQSRAILHENVSHHQVSSLLNHSDVLVIPRPSMPMTEFAYPTKLPECLATGIPLVTTDVGPVSELLTDGVDCIITRPDNSEAYRDGILRVYRMNADDRKILGQHARMLAENHLQWNQVGLPIREVFAS